MNRVVAIVLAAGRSTRMGEQNKLLLEWRGKSLVQHVVDAAKASKCTGTIVVTGHQQNEVMEALEGREVVYAHNEEYRTGIASSINAGVSRASQMDCDACVILLGDMPKITSAMIDEFVAAAGGDNIIIATSDGKRGNPLYWPQRYFDELCKLRGDEGARQIFAGHQDKIIELELGPAARFDIDTPLSL